MTKAQPVASTSKPSHWPADIQYLSHQYYHASVSNDVLSYLCPGRAQPTPMTKSMRPPVIIRDIVETGHPAKGQRGLFTCKKIAPRTHILDYVGEVHCDDRPESDYDLSLYHAPGGVNVGVDASKMGNEARFTNDYRGVRPKPNALFEERRTPSGELCMSIWSGSESIRKGEEILVSYGKGFWRARSSTAEGADSMEQPD